MSWTLQVPGHMISWTIDPLDKFKDVDPERLWEAGGYIPGWLENVWEPIYDQLIRKYPFGMDLDIPGVHVTPEGVWQDVGPVDDDERDPDLYPYLKAKVGPETIFIYVSGLVSIHRADGTQHNCRMD